MHRGAAGKVQVCSDAGTDVAADGRPFLITFINAFTNADDGRAHVQAVGAADGRADAGDARAHGAGRPLFIYTSGLRGRVARNDRGAHGAGRRPAEQRPAR